MGFSSVSLIARSMESGGTRPVRHAKAALSQDILDDISSMEDGVFPQYSGKILVVHNLSFSLSLRKSLYCIAFRDELLRSRNDGCGSRSSKTGIIEIKKTSNDAIANAP